MLAVLGDSLLIGLAVAGFGFLTSVAAIIGVHQLAKLTGNQKAMAAATERAEQRDENIAKRVHEVAVALAISDEAAKKKLAKIEDSTDKTLIHVNDQSTMHMRRHAESMEEIASLVNTDSAREKAVTARREYEEHKKLQEEAKATKTNSEEPKPIDQPDQEPGEPSPGG